MYKGLGEKYFEDLYEEDTEEWAIFNVWGFDIARMSNYFAVTYAKEFSWKEINHIQGRQNGYQLSSSLGIVRLQCLKWNYCGKGWILYIWGGKGVNQKKVESSYIMNSWKVAGSDRIAVYVWNGCGRAIRVR